jgi:hypothetical protein
VTWDAYEWAAANRADAGLVVAQLSYRAHVTRRAPPIVYKVTRL